MPRQGEAVAQLQKGKMHGVVSPGKHHLADGIPARGLPEAGPLGDQEAGQVIDLRVVALAAIRRCRALSGPGGKKDLFNLRKKA
jgi:hypothetical protein